MLERILKLYVMAMLGDVRSPLPHLFGPPGCGKSTVVEQAAELLGVNLHIINLSRLSPLELEGVQMPHGEGEEQKLKLLHATFWKDIKENDIVLFDELLRAFPEVFNGLLDILTSRKVGGLVIPKAFFIGASNTTVSYDKALEDRLLHLPVPDVRKNKAAKNQLANLIVDALGLLPQMSKTMEMQSLIDTEIAPMYEILDNLKNKTSSGAMLKGTSVRNLIGQVKLRDIRSSQMLGVIEENNRQAMREGKWQFVVLADGKAGIGIQYEANIHDIANNPKLTDVQRLNIQQNLQLVGLEKSRQEKGNLDDDDIVDDDPFAF